MVRQENLKYNLIPKGRVIYFNEEEHKYSDNFNNIYTSTTTLVGKYHEKFEDNKKAIEYIGSTGAIAIKSQTE